MENLQDILREAEAGNIEAMLKLSRYYALEGNDQSKAEEWADRAADAGSGTGYYLSLVSHNVGLAVAQHLGFFTVLRDESAIIMERATMLIMAHKAGEISLTSEQLKKIDEGMENAIYARALAEYGLDKEGERYREIAEMLEDAKTTKAYALRAVSCMNIEEYAEAFRLMVQVLHDEAYAAKEKEVLEEGIFTDALNNMALIYRVGLPGVVGQNLTEAVNVIQYALRYVKDEDFRKNLQNELNRYQKKLFGGYRYV